MNIEKSKRFAIWNKESRFDEDLYCSKIFLTVVMLMAQTQVSNKMKQHFFLISFLPLLRYFNISDHNKKPSPVILVLLIDDSYC
jgi:hypothetical protein